MKLRNRLLASFLIIILVPVVTGFILLGVVANHEMKKLRESYGYTSQENKYSSTTIQLLSSATQDEFLQLFEIAQKTPEKLEDLGFLNKFNQQLLKQHSHIDIVKNDLLIYTGTQKEEDKGYLLPKYGCGQTNPNSGYYQGGEKQILIKQIDVSYDDGGFGAVYIVSQVDLFLPEVRALAIRIIGVILMVLVLTGFAITLWIYRGIINPVKRLRMASEQIKQGNLEYALNPQGDDEMAELCKSFEEMRTRLKESTDQKMIQDQESKILISNICHDLKTPITAIQGYVEGIMDGVADTPQKQEKYLKTIHSKANEMNTLINELTLYSKLDTNRAVYNFSKLNVKAYFDDCIEEIRTELEAQEIGLGYNNSVDEGTEIIADPEQLRRVINNIIGNAVKYMNNPKRYIDFRIKDVGDYLQVEIEDSGKGITGKDLPYIFERFYRADSSRNETKGNGIGLSIVKKIMDDHGGKIWATSKVDVGTTMYFVLRKYQEVPNE